MRRLCLISVYAQLLGAMMCFASARSVKSDQSGRSASYASRAGVAKESESSGVPQIFHQAIRCL